MVDLKQRNVYIDMTRGLAIILVVLGHAIQNTFQDYDENIIFRIIYSFHMPLFMFISGFVNYRGEKNFFWLKRRAKSLLVPFIIWMFLPFILNQIWDIKQISSSIYEIVKSPDNSNWFIYILFLNCLVLYIEEVVRKRFAIERDWILFGLIYVVLCLGALLFKGWFGFGALFDNYIFFIAGYLFAEYKNRIPYKKSYVKILGCLMFIVIIPFWKRTGIPTYIQFLINYGASPFLQLGMEYLFRYIVAFGGIQVSFLFICHVKSDMIKKSLIFLGKNTLEIYLLHRYWFDIVNISNPMASIIGQCILGIVLSLGISYLIETKWMSRLLFGK